MQAAVDGQQNRIPGSRSFKHGAESLPLEQKHEEEYNHV